MSRDLLLYFDDILDAIANIREFTSRMGFHAFRSDLKTQPRLHQKPGGHR